MGKSFSKGVDIFLFICYNVITKEVKEKTEKPEGGLTMTVTYETTLKDFEFWGNARENVNKLTDEELETLEEYFYEPISQTELNDLFAFYFESVCDILGLTEEEVLARD